LRGPQSVARRSGIAIKGAYSLFAAPLLRPETPPTPAGLISGCVSLGKNELAPGHGARVFCGCGRRKPKDKMAWHHTAFCQTALPYRQVPDRVWERRNGQIALAI
jgi:hypothetical protein